MSSGNVSKEDIQREKREMLVKKGVQERGKLEVRIGTGSGTVAPGL